MEWEYFILGFSYPLIFYIGYLIGKYTKNRSNKK